MQILMLSLVSRNIQYVPYMPTDIIIIIQAIVFVPVFVCVCARAHTSAVFDACD